jgi:phytoene dehydrogenase-like protein
MKDKYDAVIIGAGMGGLSCGAWLAKNGMRVAGIEQNQQVGGFCSSYQRGGFNFTPAASEVTGTTESGLITRVIRALGIEGQIEFIPLEQGYHVHFPDFNYYIYSGGGTARERFMEQFIQLFPAEARGIRRFFDTLVAINEQADYATFLGTGPRDIARILFKCPALVRNMTRSIASFMDDYVSDPRLRAALSINSTCANLPPSKMSALGIAGLLIEGGRSIPHVKGGAQAVAEAFAGCVRASGGDILTGKLVEQILVENHKACGVRLVNSELAVAGGDAAMKGAPATIAARYVISNASARQTFFKLLGGKHVSASPLGRLHKLELTPPFCALLLGLDLDLKKMGFAPALHIHTATYDTGQHFQNLSARLTDEHAPDPLFRFQLANLSDPSSAPPGKTALVIHAIPAPVSGWEDPDFEKRVADVMIKRAEKKIPGLSRHIEYREFWSPRTVNRYTLSGEDASIGWALTPQQVGPRRLGQKTPVKNLYLSGHWTQPALGIIGVTVSGLQAARAILSLEGVSEPLADIGIRGGVRVS